MLAPIPHDEEARIRELMRCGILDTPPDAAFDRITALAAQVFKVPTALVVFVDRERQWFKSRHGIHMQEERREPSFCAHTILENRVLVVPDARADERFARNPCVGGVSPIRFYAGAPLVSNGQRIVVDTVPRQDFGPREEGILADLARMVCAELERHTTSLSQTHSALHAAEAKYRGIFENAIEGIYQTLPDGTLMSANPAFARLLGHDTPQGMIEAVVNFGSLYVQDTRRTEFQQRVDTDGFVTSFESEVRRADGACIWISENARAIRDGRGNLLHYEGTVEDVSSRRAAEAALQGMQEELENRVRVRTAELALVNGDLRLLLREREEADEILRRSEARFRAMIENAQDLITVLSVEGTMVYQSPSLEHVFGFRPEEIVGRSVLDHVHPGDRQRVQEAMARILVHGENHVREEVRLLHKDGTWRLAESVGSRTPPDSPIPGLIINSRDVTERRHAEKLHEARTRQQTAIGELSRFALDAGSDLPAIFDKAVALATGTLGVEFVTVCEMLPGGAHLAVVDLALPS